MMRYDKRGRKRGRESGVALVEAMIAIMVFSFGILGLLGVQANAIKIILSSKARADAGNLADQMVGQMWADRQNLATYAHQPNGAAACAPSGAVSTNPAVTTWLAALNTSLPGAQPGLQQISIGANNLVRVTICWKLPQESVTHSFSETAQING